MSAIPEKTNKALRFILLALLLILFRIGHLSLTQQEEHQELAQKPKRKSLIEPAERGTIRDRHQTGLALNRICYQAAIYYGQIAALPSVLWEKDEAGKKVKRSPRREYIQKLAHLLGEELSLDPDRVVDLIYSKAALLPHAPFILKEHLTEKEYFRLRMLERDWTGLHAHIAPERFYPLGKTGCDVLGYMGAINQEEYFSIAEKIWALEDFLEEKEPFPPEGIVSREEALRALAELKEKAYTLNDRVGKAGIEKSLERELRGFYGAKVYEVDNKGNFLQELRGSRERLQGKKVVLSLSAELQEFAEALLAEDEALQQQKAREGEQKFPWIRGGAIVAMNPNNGEILALASYPRFDPNDYVTEEKEKSYPRIHRWLETEEHIARLWDGKEMLAKELYTSGEFHEERVPLTWERFLGLFLPKKGEIFLALEKIHTVQKAVQLQEDFEELLYLSGQKDPSLLFSSEKMDNRSQEILKRWSSLFSSLPHHQDKLFLIDLCRLAVFSPAFSDELVEKMAQLSLSSYRARSQAILQKEGEHKPEIRKWFHEIDFKPWKEANEKAYLKEMRLLEKAKKTYARPYIDYLDKKEEELFQEFWRAHRISFLSSYLKKTAVPIDPYFSLLQEKGKNSSLSSSLQELVSSLEDGLFENFLQTVRSYHDLDRPLYHVNARLKKQEGISLEKHLAAAFYPKTGFGYSRSFAFRQAATLGSNFKLVTAYAALKNRMEAKEVKTYADLSPFTMVDDFRWDAKAGKKGSFVVGYSLDHAPYPRMYKGGRLPRSSHMHVGKIDLLSALEQSSNPYFALLSSDHLKRPDDLLESAKAFGFGNKTGILLAGEIAGALPKDLETNRTGLYSFAIGQHSLAVTPLQTALMIGAIANQGKVFTPQIVQTLTGKKRPPPFASEYLPHQEDFQALPVYTEDFSFAPEVKRSLFFPDILRNALLEGMHRVVSGEKGNARADVIKGLRKNKDLLQRYKEVGRSFVGKTSTAEVLYNPYMYPSSKPSMYTHAWFGAISFPSHSWNHPELVVVVYLRFREAGKEAAPLAFRMVEKYREIQKNYASEQ